MIGLFSNVPGFEGMNLTLTSILGLDTYHQPLISVDDFARKYFSDNNLRIVRVVGKSNPAIEAMAAFVEGLKRPFSASEFPHHGEFLVSGFRGPSPGKSAEVKLLFKPADPALLMRIEREVKLHIDEANLGREIHAARHYTREQPPELILASTSEAPKGRSYLEALAASLPRASSEDVAAAKLASERTPEPSAAESGQLRPHFARDVERSLAPTEQRKRVIQSLAEILKTSGFSGFDVRLVDNGTAIRVEFPRSPAKLWLLSSFDEKTHIGIVQNALTAVQADPLLRDGYDLHYRFDGKTLQLRAVDAGTRPVAGAKAVMK